MTKVNRDFGILRKEDREKAIKEIIGYFQDERGEIIGVVAAELVLDFFLLNVGPGIYNKAIDDVVNLMREKMEGMEYEFEALKRNN